MLLAACGGGGTQAPANAAEAADMPLLFMGNSHTEMHDVPATVAALVHLVRPGKTVLAIRAPAIQFLEDHAQDATTLSLLRLRPWRAVVLQAQKISSSGQFEYPTAPAEALALEARQRGAVPVLFAEWPRRGVAEMQRTFDIYLGIARRQPACVAPVGQAWENALLQWPLMPLHEADGNHANAHGAFLAALVLASTLTGAAPLDFPALPSMTVDATTQARLRSAAAQAVAAVPPRALCPGDPLL